MRLATLSILVTLVSLQASCLLAEEGNLEGSGRPIGIVNFWSNPIRAAGSKVQIDNILKSIRPGIRIGEFQIAEMDEDILAALSKLPRVLRLVVSTDLDQDELSGLMQLDNVAELDLVGAEYHTAWLAKSFKTSTVLEFRIAPRSQDEIKIVTQSPAVRGLHLNLAVIEDLSTIECAESVERLSIEKYSPVRDEKGGERPLRISGEGLRSLVLEDVWGIDEEWIEHLHPLTRLRSLTMRNCTLAAPLAQFINPDLEHLYIIDVELLNRQSRTMTASDIALALSKTKALTSFGLTTDVAGLVGESSDLVALGGELARQEHLEYLTFDVSRDIGPILPFIGKLSELKTLVFGESYLAAEDFEHLRNCAALNELWVGGANFGPGHASRISQLTSLKYLNLWRVQFDASSFQLLKGLESLVGLALGHVEGMPSDGFKQLLQGLNLEMLHLRWFDSRDQDGNKLKLSRQEVLVLAGAGVQKSGVRIISVSARTFEPDDLLVFAAKSTSSLIAVYCVPEDMYHDLKDGFSKHEDAEVILRSEP